MQTNAINLSGRKAIVTGGARGIGHAIASRLLESGAEVSLWDINSDTVTLAAEELGEATAGRALAFEVDIASYDSVAAATAATREAMGGIDILINNAAITGPNAPVADYPVDAWAEVMRVDINGTFHCCRAVVPAMQAGGYGRIVNIASVAGKEGNPNAAAYSAAKAAVIALTKSLGKELATQDIAVNCITPALVRRVESAGDAQSEAQLAYMLSRIPRGRFLEASEIASMVSWLVSEENSFTTGAVFDISGGRATY